MTDCAAAARHDLAQRLAADEERASPICIAAWDRVVQAEVGAELPER